MGRILLFHFICAACQDQPRSSVIEMLDSVLWFSKRGEFACARSTLGGGGHVNLLLREASLPGHRRLRLSDLDQKKVIEFFQRIQIGGTKSQSTRRRPGPDRGTTQLAMEQLVGSPRSPQATRSIIRRASMLPAKTKIGIGNLSEE